MNKKMKITIKFIENVDCKYLNTKMIKCKGVVFTYKANQALLC